MGTVYRGLTQDQLDSEYDNQRHVPGFRALVAEYAARSAAARATLSCRLGVPYGEGERQRLDVFPAGAGAPVHVFFHGGAWRSLTRGDAAAAAPAMVAAGVCYVAAGFDLATDVPLDTMVHQARSAVAWLASHVAEFGGDPARITLSGHSSGAHLAAMVAATDWPGQFGLAADVVKGALLVSGLYDLEPVRLSYRNTMLRLDAAGATRLSPVCRRAPGARVVLATAEHETGEFHRQSRMLHEAWATAPVIVAAGRNHYDVALDLADPAKAVGAACQAIALG